MSVRETDDVTRPVPSNAGVAARMAKQRRTDTAPEMLLRRDLHKRGLRYRVNAPLPVDGLRRRRADLLFTRAKVAVFVDGCFWHACPIHATAPKANEAWWATKLNANVARDRDTNERLRHAGWVVLRFWEHEDPALAAIKVELTVRSNRPGA